MVYNVIGLMSGSSLDGLDIVYVSFQETSGKWTYSIECAGCLEYSKAWREKLRSAVALPAREYLLLHSAYGNYTGEKVNEFINLNDLHHRVSLIASHGHTTFHMPQNAMTHQLGDGAAIAAITGLPVVSDLRSLDVAFGGHGAPIVPVGEKLLFPEYDLFLNIGGIANLSVRQEDNFTAFDICPANRVLNMLVEGNFIEFDEGGKLAATGEVNDPLLADLNKLNYYSKRWPKSLSNDFGTHEVFPLIQTYLLNSHDSLRTYCEHIAFQIGEAVSPFLTGKPERIMITGGGAFNKFLIDRISFYLQQKNVEIYIPGDETVAYKEALIMGLLGVLRWREQYNVLASVTGASKDSIGGALWLGTDA